MNLSRRAMLRAAGAGAMVLTGLSPAAEISPPATTRSVPFRPFKPSSYWNRPIPPEAPIDRESGRYIDDFKKNSSTHLRLVLTEKWSSPVYWPHDGDREFSIEVDGKPYKVRLPADAYSSTGADGAMTVIDVQRKVAHSLHRAHQENERWVADGVAEYFTDSNGLDGRLKQSDEPRNYGHRGIPPTIMMVRKDEIEAGVIAHKLEMFAHATADEHFFPMAGHEHRKGGVIPEGILLRIKPSVDLRSRKLKSNALIVATALQTFGIVVGDNSGSGNNLKVERAAIPLFDKDDLESITWDDWEAIERGFGG